MEEKKFMIFYYDLDFEGYPLQGWENINELYENISKFYQKRNIEILMLPRYISHSGVLFASEIIEALERYIKNIKEHLNDR